MEKSIKIYLSAFLPVLWILIIKDCLTLITIVIKDNQPLTIFLNWSLIIAFTITTVLTISFFLMLSRNKDLSYDIIIVKNVTNRTAEYFLGYFSLFILALLSFSLTNFVDLIVLCLVLFVLGIVYIKNDLYFINPTLNLFKGYVYEIEYEEQNKMKTRIVFSKRKIELNKKVNIEVSEYSFAFIKEDQDKKEKDNTNQVNK